MITGKINEPVKLVSSITGDWVQTKGPKVNLRVALDQKSASFTPSEKGLYVFQRGNQTFEVSIGTVTPEPTPPPEPTPTPEGVIWDSKVHTKLHDGKTRTITKEGSITPNGKGVECRASGSPKIQVNADNTFSLVSGSGGVDNFSYKMRSRHNEGGDCPNRFGGFGGHIERGKTGMKTESCHNNHENSKEVSCPNVFDDKFHTLEFQVKDSAGKVDQTTWIDGQKVLEHPHNSPKDFYLHKALYDKQSYLWLRLNNSDHGRIYVYCTNYNSKLKAIFKIEPSKNAVTFQHVQLIGI